MEIKGKKWNGNLNYAGAMHLDLDCDIIDLAIIDIIEDYVKLKYIKKTILDGDLLFKFDWHYIPKRCPYLPSQSRSSIFSRLEKLEKLCIIERVDLKVNEMWLKFGSRYEDFINAAESSKTDSNAKTVRHGGLPESGTVDSPESGTVDSISRDITSCDNTSESEQEDAREEIKVTPRDAFKNTKMKAYDIQYYGEKIIQELLPDKTVPNSVYGKEWLAIYGKLLTWGQKELKGNPSGVTLHYGINTLSVAIKYMSQYHKDNFTIPYLARKFDEILPESRNNKKKLSKRKETYHPTGGAVWEDPKNYNPRG